MHTVSNQGFFALVYAHIKKCAHNNNGKKILQRQTAPGIVPLPTTMCTHTKNCIQQKKKNLQRQRAPGSCRFQPSD